MRSDAREALKLEFRRAYFEVANGTVIDPKEWEAAHAETALSLTDAEGHKLIVVPSLDQTSAYLNKGEEEFIRNEGFVRIDK